MIRSATIRFGHGFAVGRQLACSKARNIPKLSTWNRPRPLTKVFPQTVSTRYQTRAMSSSITVVSTPNAPSAIGPYEQAIKANGFVFVSGCIPLDPTSMQVVSGGIVEQTTQVFKNLTAVVEASGSTLDKVVKTTVFLKSMEDFAAMNGVYASAFGDHKPARSAVEVARLPKDVLVEVECIALAS